MTESKINVNELDWVKEFAESVVDLRECQFGDFLISRHGAVLCYMGPTKETDYMDHVVEYIYIPRGSRLNPQSMGSGTRTHDGYVFRKNRLEEDHDIVKIIKCDTDEHYEILHSRCDILRNYLITLSRTQRMNIKI